jgi:hypothetical protein
MYQPSGDAHPKNADEQILFGTLFLSNPLNFAPKDFKKVFLAWVYRSNG